MTTTCIVCGAAEEPGRDNTCPVCGADLPADAPATEEADVTASVEEPAWPDGVSVPDTAREGEAEAAEATPPMAGGPVPPPPPPAVQGTRPRPSPHDPSHPSGLSGSLRTYGMWTHLSAFPSALIALAFVGPLVLWLIRRDEHPFLDHHGKEAVNFNLSMLLYFVVGVVATIATLGVGLVVVAPAAAVFFVTWIVTIIIAATKASRGEGYRYPLSIRFIKD